jgi:hypothetical protein
MAVGQCELRCTSVYSVVKLHARLALHPARCCTPLLHLIFGRKAESVTFAEIFFLKVGMECHWFLLPASRTG